ncbi:hypothetical protein HRbin36_01263 [bacterium HR36]|nr:hypothetical protein HRbin36_01263 [bacterium HR36]
MLSAESVLFSALVGRKLQKREAFTRCGTQQRTAAIEELPRQKQRGLVKHATSNARDSKVAAHQPQPSPMLVAHAYSLRLNWAASYKFPWTDVF